MITQQDHMADIKIITVNELEKRSRGKIMVAVNRSPQAHSWVKLAMTIEDR